MRKVKQILTRCKHLRKKKHSRKISDFSDIFNFGTFFSSFIIKRLVKWNYHLRFFEINLARKLSSLCTNSLFLKINFIKVSISHGVSSVPEERFMRKVNEEYLKSWLLFFRVAESRMEVLFQTWNKNWLKREIETQY